MSLFSSPANHKQCWRGSG